MESVFEWLAGFRPSGYIPGAILFVAVGIFAPIVFIVARRAIRRRYFSRLNRRTFELRQRWTEVLEERIAPETWRFKPLDCEIVETIVLDQLEVAPPEQTAKLVQFLRRSGLIDMRIWEARHERGGRRQGALVSLGRMHVAEVIPALAEALDDADADTRVAAMRGLGRTGLPEAADEILKRVTRETFRVPTAPLQNALLACCHSNPNLLLEHIRRASDRVRPLLARVLGEVATPELNEELLLLASDPLPEVRASAARAIGFAKPRLAMTALSSLAADAEWFVRLRAVVAMGELSDPRSMPVLIGALCDSNRHVRLRAAQALVRFERRLTDILCQVISTHDRYALQTFVSELERSGRMLTLIQALLDPTERTATQNALLDLLRAGAHRLMLDSLANHSSWRIRVAIARLLAASGEGQLVTPLEALEISIPNKRGRCVVRWVLRRLRDGATLAPQPSRATT